VTANETNNAVNEFTTKGVETMASLGDLNLRMFERMTTRQMDAVNLAMDYGLRVMKLASDSKGYDEFFKGQVEATKELSERVMAESKTNLELAGQVRDDYRTWFEKNLAEVSANLRQSAPAA
jgi:hypothetical protein